MGFCLNVSGLAWKWLLGQRNSDWAVIGFKFRGLALIFSHTHTPRAGWSLGLCELMYMSELKGLLSWSRVFLFFFFFLMGNLEGITFHKERNTTEVRSQRLQKIISKNILNTRREDSFPNFLLAQTFSF